MRKLIIPTLLMVIVWSCEWNIKYDTTLDGDQIRAVIETMRVIEIRGEVYRFGREEATSSRAISIAIGRNLIVAETHATQIPTTKIARTPFGMAYIQQDVLEERFFIDDIEIELVGRYKDISLFRTPFEMDFVPLGDSDLLEVGTRVIAVGWSFGRGINVKDGIVSMFVIDDQFDPPNGTIKDISFMMTAPVNPGDSGSPVLAERNGRYEIVGLSCATVQDHGLGFAYKINFIKEALKIIQAS